MKIHPSRLFNYGTKPAGCGPVIYWMQRDQRVDDNWALLYAQQQALVMNQPLVVIFCLVNHFIGASPRHYLFMIDGLQEVEKQLARRKIHFILLAGNPQDVIPGYVSRLGAGLVVTDFNPLRLTMTWRKEVAARIPVPLTEVDAHNIIPCRFISGKMEYAAFTLRKKIVPLLAEFLTAVPPLVPHPIPLPEMDAGTTDWDAIPNKANNTGSANGISAFRSGQKAAFEAMEQFLHTRLERYNTDRNLPEIQGQSDLSPYLHFGQLSAQRLAFEVQRTDADASSRAAYLEELIVRRELSDNFCLYNERYDTFEGFQPWARDTLNRHRDDAREYLYGPEEWERAATHDPLWNAAQREMMKTGKMHGFMRMYWAKKILEWSRSPEEALQTAIWLNDTYSLDGRDPNGYAGIAWSIGGTHDRPWGERPVFGMIRYMNYAGCKRKFNINLYLSKINTL